MPVGRRNYNDAEKLRGKFFDFLLKKPCTSGQAAEYLSSLDAAEEMPAEPPIPAPEAEETAAYPGSAAESYGVTPLAQAEYPAAIGVEDYDDASANWVANQTDDNTKAALNAFAYRTAAAILRDNGVSGAYSPLSLYQALAVLTSGSQGNTRDQLLSLLGQPDLETLADQAGKLYRVNYKYNELDTLQIANSLWLDETLGNIPVEYSREWVMSAAIDYYADVFEAEFDTADTPGAMGVWIAEHTGGLLHPSLEFSPETVMAIVNTLYYKSAWVDEFLPGNTSPDNFTTDGGETVQADFMHRTDDSGTCIQTDRYTKSSLNLSIGRMIFVLPAEGMDVDELLTEESLWEIFENGDYQSAKVNWSVPKFVNNATFELLDTLEALGVTDAFDGNTADFGLIADTPLYVSQVQQGTHIGVDEEGVEAAAYTEIALAGEGLPEELPEIDMNLNRPFLYLITANDGSTLFIGVVRNPTG